MVIFIPRIKGNSAGNQNERPLLFCRDLSFAFHYKDVPKRYIRVVKIHSEIKIHFTPGHQSRYAIHYIFATFETLIYISAAHLHVIKQIVSGTLFLIHVYILYTNQRVITHSGSQRSHKIMFRVQK